MTTADSASSDRHIPVSYDQDGEPYWHSTTTPPDPSYGICAMVPDRIIPVVFVPGIMGSNLRSKGGGPSWNMNKKTSLISWAWRDAADRKKYLQAHAMEVDPNGAIPAGTQQLAKHLQTRGWGEVGNYSYGAFLVWLENALNDFDNARFHRGERDQLIGKGLGADTGEEALTCDEVALSYRYRFPVWACGYNWLDDNKVSAQRLQQRIHDAIDHYQKKKLKCEKVILVTHSMGGLVARHCSEVLGERDRIFGIVHGVMPATGAAATYRRAKAGTGGGFFASRVLGNTAAEMTAVLSTSPGALELLPTPEYGNGWLRIEADGQNIALPMSGDPYGEIYAVRGKWWGLIDDTLMNPLNTARRSNAHRSNQDSDWSNYVYTIKQTVKPFQSSISNRYNLCTYTFYASSNDHLAYGNVTWEGHSLFGERWWTGKKQPDILNGKDTHIVGTGGTSRSVFAPFKTATVGHAGINQEYVISNPEAPGDGTVPERSGVAPKSRSRSILAVDTEHEAAFRDCRLAQHFTLRAIVKIAQAVKATALAYT